MSLARQFASNVIAQGLARLISIGANLLLLLVVARTLGAESFGQFSYVLAFAAIAVTFADLGTTAILSQGLVHHEGDRRRRYIGNFLLMRTAFVVPVMLGAVVAALLIHDHERGALLAVAFGLPVLASRFFEPVYQVYGKPWLSLSSNLMFGASQLVLTALVWRMPDLGLTWLTIGHVLSNLLYTVVAMVLMWRLAPPLLWPDRGLLREMAQLAAPIGVGTIFSTLMMRFDVIMLKHLRDSVEVGHYSAAFRLIDLAVFLAVTAVTPFITILSKDLATGSSQALPRARQFTIMAGLFAVPVALTVPVLADDLVALVWGVSFAPAASPLRVLMLNFVIVFLSLICYSINVASKKVGHAFWASPLATVVNIGLNVWWIPILGITGAAWASVIAQALVLAVAQYYVTKDFGNLYEPGPWLRLALASVALVVAQQLVLPFGGTWAAAAAGLVVFGLLVAWSGLLPRGVLSALRNRRADEAPPAT